ncbi:calpain-C [Leptidea sinapis]|uniref:calpain-C n=1 Tax=Leptidea sinapis TaxID=189913 RepID=UPI00211F4DBA|nr:calpain-C [Leptidea sinapis]
MAEYEKIKAMCLQKQQLWEDPDFPATQASVFYHQTPPFEFEWKRPHELYANPKFINETYDAFDVVTSILGDQWMRSCFGLLYLYKGLFFRVIPGDQQMDSDYAGIFRFRIWWCGKWMEVLVDDRLPTVHGRLAFMHCSESEQLWPALLEKAYAKMHGSYEALKYGNLHDGLVDLTGGITETIALSDMKDPMALYNLLQTTSLVTAYRVDHSITLIKSEIGYRIYHLEKVDTDGGYTHVVRLERPLAPGEVHFNHFVLDKHTWSSIIPSELARLTSISSGFWMLYKDFQKIFSRLEIVHVDGEAKQIETSLRDKQKWQIKSYQGRWMKGVSAGGCRNHADFFHMNPQIQLVISQHDNVYISLSQHCIMEPKVIGFSIYKLSKSLSESASPALFKKIKSSMNSQYTNSRQVSERCSLDVGTYLIIPTTFEPRQEGSFTLRVCSINPINMNVLDSLPKAIKPAIVKAPTEIISYSMELYESQFLQLSDEHKTINAFELQELLDRCLPNDYIKSCATIETCRQIVLSMENDHSGRITLAEFKDLIYSLKNWQDIFKMHSTEQKGVLRVERFRDALRDVGFVVPERALALLVLKYMRKDELLRFGDFVSAVLLLHRAFHMFFKNGSTYKNNFTLPEWLKLTLTF